jgi:hypothetical protein
MPPRGKVPGIDAASQETGRFFTSTSYVVAEDEP